MPKHAAAPTNNPRVDWVDFGKGICIFFVVMLHVNELVQNHLQAIGWLEHVVEFARPFRMPDFFLIAGLFLSNVIDRPWRTYLDRKVVHFVYFYGLWMTLTYIGFDARSALRDGADVGSVILGYFIRFIDPVGPLWFIHMLPIFFVFTKLTKSTPWWVIWTAAAVLHSARVNTGWMVPDEFSARFIYFYSGYIFASRIFLVASWAQKHPQFSMIYLVAWAFLNQTIISLGWAKLPGISLALGYLGALAVIFAATLFTRITWAKPIRYMGENSIVIYLGDYLVSVIMLRVFLPFVPDIGTLALAITIATVIGTVALWRIMLRTPARFMYVRPTWMFLAKKSPSPVDI